MIAGKFLADIIQTELSIPQGRVVLYNQNFKPPKDDDIFVVIALQTPKIISSSNRFEPADAEAEPPTNDREVKSVAKSETWIIEITSKNTDAMEQLPAVIASLTSNYSEQLQESNSIRIFRTATIQDLSFIEGGSSLHRYRIPVIINSTEVIVKDIITYNKYQTPQEVVE